jgi:hypothetical protein
MRLYSGKSNAFPLRQGNKKVPLHIVRTLTFLQIFRCVITTAEAIIPRKVIMHLIYYNK